jgi:hypothetical protein
LSFEIPAKNQSASCTAFAPASQCAVPLAATMQTMVVQKCSARIARNGVRSSTPISGTSTARGQSKPLSIVGATNARAEQPRMAA